MLQDWFKCLRKKRSRIRFCLFLSENLAESNKGLLLRPGAMAEGVERAAKRRMQPVGFHIDI